MRRPRGSSAAAAFTKPFHQMVHHRPDDATGLAPHQWQLGRRMARAQALLTGSSRSIAEIALACGFSSQSHFATAFREAVGVSPGRWRRSAGTSISGADGD